DLLGQPCGVGARLQTEHERVAVDVVGPPGHPAYDHAPRVAPTPRARSRGAARSAWARRARAGLRGPRRTRGDDRPHLDRLLAGADRAVLDQSVVAAEG